MQIVYDEVSKTQAKPSHREKNVQYLTGDAFFVCFC